MVRDSKVSLVDKVYWVAKARILNAQMLPDSFIDEAKLAAELGISKTPVRQAMVRLAAEGFIRVLPQRGTMINPITIADLQQVYLLRSLLEPAASELAATRATVAQIEHLRDLDRRFQMSGEAFPDLDLHTAIHVGVAQIAGVARMTKMIAELQDQMRRFLAVRAVQGGPLPPNHSHTALISAIGAGDSGAAARITRENIARSREDVVETSENGMSLYSCDSFEWLPAGQRGPWPT